MYKDPSKEIEQIYSILEQQVLTNKALKNTTKEQDEVIQIFKDQILNLQARPDLKANTIYSKLLFQLEERLEKSNDDQDRLVILEQIFKINSILWQKKQNTR